MEKERWMAAANEMESIRSVSGKKTKKKSDMTLRRGGRESQMSRLRAARDGRFSGPSPAGPRLRQTERMRRDLPHHYGGQGLRPLWLPPPHLRRLPRENQILEVVEIRRAAAPILVLSSTDQNLQSAKES